MEKKKPRILKQKQKTKKKKKTFSTIREMGVSPSLFSICTTGSNSDKNEMVFLQRQTGGSMK
jgi:hypothetical protein